MQHHGQLEVALWCAAIECFRGRQFFQGCESILEILVQNVESRGCVSSRITLCFSRGPGQPPGCRHKRIQSNVGTLIIRIGFRGFLIIIIVQYTPKPYSNY